MNHITMQHMQKENRRKPSVFAGFLAGAEGLVSAAASVGPGRSPPGCRPPRHALRRAQPHLVAEPLCPLTKNREASIVLTSLILAGAEGLGLACRLGRLVACVPPARTRPTTRGFGVDVGKHTRERGRVGVDQFLLQVRKGGAGLVLWGKIRPKAPQILRWRKQRKSFSQQFL